jgi:hypothetical protein
MDKELIKKLAMQAGEYANKVYVPPARSKTPGKIWEDSHVGWHEIFNEKFAKLVAEHEREKCAMVCEELPAPDIYDDSDKSMWDVACMDCAEAIRNRGT